jgi:hypothetical protein
MQHEVHIYMFLWGWDDMGTIPVSDSGQINFKLNTT